MNAVVVVLLRALSYLPLWALYALGGLLRFLLCDLISYRKAIIRTNIQRSFPEMDEDQVRKTVSDYYVYLSELIMENIYLLRMPSAELRKRVTFDQPELLEAFQKDGTRGMIMMGHSGNWEWAGLATAERFSFRFLPIYRRIKSDAMDAYMLSIRSRFNAQPVLDKAAFDAAVNEALPHTFAVLADQTPSGKKGWWMQFMHQATPFYRGGEVLAQRFGYQVVFAHVFRERRGYYRIHLERYEPVTKDKGEMTRAFASFLSNQIQQQPPNWLWSHKRWKHQPDANSNWIDKA
jgi:KDO2-lipid IV(A) lauroyltransferase